MKKKQRKYIPLDTSGNKYQDMVGMSPIDRRAYDANTKSWHDASARGDQAAMDAAHRSQEAIRRNYFYSGGADGSQYIPYPKFNYAQTPSYTSRYDKDINGLEQQIRNTSPFSYNPSQDPLYGVYSKAYTDNGRRAMQDTSAKLNARSGGLANSFANTAAQRTYNTYMQRLNDKIPELQQIAYGQYQQDLANQRRNLDTLRSMEAEDFNKYRVGLNQFNADRNMAYGAFRDDMSDRRDERNFAYGVNRDNIADRRYIDQMNYNRGRDSIADQRYIDQLNYNRGRDSIADERYADQLKYNRGRDSIADERYEEQREYNKSRDEIADQKWAAELALRQGSKGQGIQEDELSAKYPDGIIKDKDEWDALAEIYGEDALTEAGYGYEGGSDAEGHSLKDVMGVTDLGIGPIDYAGVSKLVDEGWLTVSDGPNGKVQVSWAPGKSAEDYIRSNGKNSGFYGFKR